MKTLKKITLLLLMLTSTLSFAKENKVLKIKTSAKLAVLEFQNVREGQELLVKDENGLIMYSETIQESGDLSKVFDLKKLKDGFYSIELDKDFEIVIQPFEIKNNTIQFDNNFERKIFKPLVNVDYNTLKVSKLSLDNSPVQIEIYFGDELIHSESIQNEKIINRIYKLSKKTKGEYHTVVKSNDRRYVEYFKI